MPTFDRPLKSSPLPNPPPGASLGQGAAIPGSLLSANEFTDKMFWRGLKTSAAVHAGLTIAVVLATIAIPREPVKFISSIRVDLIGLPDVAKKDIKNFSTTDDLAKLNERLTEAGKGAKKLLEKPKHPQEDPVPGDTMTMKTKSGEKIRERNLKNAVDRIKALSSLENDDDKPKTKQSASLAKGNMLSKGNSLTGSVAVDSNTYLGRLQAKVKDNWNLPIWLTRQKLTAKIVIFLDSAGGVKSTMFVSDSGNKQFNDYVLRTIESAEPFGPPPSQLVDRGITLGFPL